MNNDADESGGQTKSHSGVGHQQDTGGQQWWMLTSAELGANNAKCDADVSSGYKGIPGIQNSIDTTADATKH